MFSGRFPFAAGSITLLALVFIFSVNCDAQHRVSSCGDIHNISFPFRLKSGPNDNCGNENLQLACENNRTILHYKSGKYYVQAIDYNNYTISMVDVGIQRNNCSARPLHSLAPSNFTYTYPHLVYIPGQYQYQGGVQEYVEENSMVLFVSCENPVKLPLYIDIPAACENGVSSSSKRHHSYVLFGDMTISYLADSCTLEFMAMAKPFFGGSSSYGRNISNFLDVHRELANGFELSWAWMPCKTAKRQNKLCFGNAQNITLYCGSKPRLTAGLVVHQLRWFFGHQLRWVFSRHQLRFYWHEFLYHRSHPWTSYFFPDYTFLLKVIAPILVARFLCAFGFLIRKFMRRHRSMYDDIEGFLRSQNHLMPINYSYSDIRKMTKGFRDKLGEGGYGTVYKGKLRSGHLVAVKMLGRPKADGQEFINEVATIGRIHHVNVVQLIGYCAHRSKRALVYGFMPNGSLEKYLCSQEGNFSLSCEQMYEISLGVARGIEYLHRGCDMQILHFDIKPHNILLDENFTPKVSDFGLAKLYPTDDSIVSLTAARGTLGYMAPELYYKNIGGISYKADVYSFRMLLMEMAGRRRNWNALADSSQIYFPSWVYDQFIEGRHVEMGETMEEEEKEMVKKMMVVALWCIQMNPNDRPSMNKVVEMLQGNIEDLQIPPKPFLYPQATNPTEYANLSGACLESITLDISAR